MWSSISHIIQHMETFPKVGGACGEIEVLVPDKDENGTEQSQANEVERPVEAA